VLPPAGMVFTAQDAPADADSDVDGFGYSGPFTVAAGDALDLDAGVLPPPPT
jgi:hypothetical protein